MRVGGPGEDAQELALGFGFQLVLILLSKRISVAVVEGGMKRDNIRP
jgi:hypothetical protein